MFPNIKGQLSTRPQVFNNISFTQNCKKYYSLVLQKYYSLLKKLYEVGENSQAGNTLQHKVKIHKLGTYLQHKINEELVSRMEKGQ